MPYIIGVKFRNVGKVYYFNPTGLKVRYHDHVIVETARGIEYGTVVIPPTEVSEDKITSPLKDVIRMATEEDDLRDRENHEHEKEAYRICREKIRERGLDMKLIGAEYTFDNSKVLFYFTADGRIDFRELVKDLAGIFKTRIELRQIGVRDETKLLGGIGSCGRPLCCHTWLSEFAPVSIKMAKDQNLSLNPAKISGSCGRLMCCLKNEADTYAYLNKSLPGKGDYVTTPDGLHGDVHSVNILRQKVKVIVDLGDDEKELREFDVSEISFIPKSKRPRKEAVNQGGRKADAAEKAEREEKPERPETEEAAASESRQVKTEQPAPDEEWPDEDRKGRNRRGRKGRERKAGPDGQPAERHERKAAPDGQPAEKHERKAGPEGQSAEKHERKAASGGQSPEKHERKAADGQSPEKHGRRTAPDGQPSEKHGRKAPSGGQSPEKRERKAGPDGQQAEKDERRPDHDGQFQEKHERKAAPAGQEGDAEKKRYRRRRPRHKETKSGGSEG